jgi:hypothetical protein
MKRLIKAFLNQFLIVFISFFLFYIGMLYSDDIGFYSRELLSSGSDDFGIFIGTTFLNFLGLIFGILNIIYNIIELKIRRKIINFSYTIYIIIFVSQLFLIFLINLDTDLFYVFNTFDLFSVWILVFIFGTLTIIISMKILKKIVVDFEYIDFKLINRILLIIGGIIILKIIITGFI